MSAERRSPATTTVTELRYYLALTFAFCSPILMVSQLECGGLALLSACCRLPSAACLLMGGEEIMCRHGQSPLAAALSRPWRLPPHGLAVFHGERYTPRLSHYFMPRLALEGKRILFLDGANCADPRLMARLAERRGIPFAQFNQQIMLARAFTCFQLTELISRVPQFLAEFPAQVLMVTAFPELYFDEDVRQADAHAAFQQALGHLRRCALYQTVQGCALTNRNWELGTGNRVRNETRNSNIETRERGPNFESRVSNFDPDAQDPTPGRPTVTVALFSGASGFQPPAGRRRFFAQTCAAATELWKFQADGQGRLGLTQTVLGAQCTVDSKVQIPDSESTIHCSLFTVHWLWRTHGTNGCHVS